MVKIILLVSAFAFAAGCSKHKEFVPEYNVPAEFQPYVDAFTREAASRGHSYIIKNLIIQYDTNKDGTLCGACNSISLDAPVQKIISINPGIQCWNNSAELETLIFHELGHCFLGRIHTNERLPKGDPKSIMVPDNLALYSPCIYNIGGQPCDNSFKRAYYLDELFDEKTAVPEWGK